MTGVGCLDCTGNWGENNRRSGLVAEVIMRAIQELVRSGGVQEVPAQNNGGVQRTWLRATCWGKEQVHSDHQHLMFLETSMADLLKHSLNSLITLPLSNSGSVEGRIHT